ncbi:uncharacterized protein LY79DRAFT_267500 [Colletotrichum navitas]|uniref:Uncharacterized protein n=1 Tax=Colletotrichum navitas TaxID=681940 RepID=A0AAD8PWH2_9PEZI|nr:uncharacterized protein LY79DRAFT_267500 [Colletotrichum navitas]KAK1585391.1 hypothetical protein LY79DRAFT_267500 [Colletotrichum navitas]
MSCQHSQLTEIVDRSTGCESVIARRLQDSRNALTKSWTTSILFMIGSPSTIATVSFFSGLSPPVDRLLTAAQLMALMPCFIQLDVYLRFHLNHCTNPIARRVLSVALGLGISGVACIAFMFAPPPFYTVVRSRWSPN